MRNDHSAPTTTGTLVAVKVWWNSRKVAGFAPSSFVANARKRSSRSRNADSSSSDLLYGLPPTIASLEWKITFSTGTPRSTTRRASAHIASNDENEGRSQSTRARPSFFSTRLVVYGNGARAYARA